MFVCVCVCVCVYVSGCLGIIMMTIVLIHSSVNSSMADRYAVQTQIIKYINLQQCIYIYNYNIGFMECPTKKRYINHINEFKTN